MMNQEVRNKHNQYAPYWAIVLFVLCITGLSTIWFDLGNFWNGYVLDMTGPAWNYILFRGLYTFQANNSWTRFFTPARTLVFFLLACLTLESAQYFKLYNATFDWWDLLAYISILLPLYLVDAYLVKKENLPKYPKTKSILGL